MGHYIYSPGGRNIANSIYIHIPHSHGFDNSPYICLITNTPQMKSPKCQIRSPVPNPESSLPTCLMILGYLQSYINMLEINPNNTQLSDPSTPPPKKKNIARFNDLLSKADFSNITSSKCANTAYHLFLETINLFYEQSFPAKTITRRRNQIKREPWITRGILKSAKTKAKLYR